MEKWGSVSGPLFFLTTDVGAEGAETQILARNFFSTNNPPPPPNLSSQNDQRDVGIILSHRCWVAPPPPRHGRSGTPALSPPPVTAAKEGGRGVGKMGFRVTPPPPAEQFSSRPAVKPCTAVYRQAMASLLMAGNGDSTPPPPALCTSGTEVMNVPPIHHPPYLGQAVC